MTLASWHIGHFRIALLLALLLPWQNFAAAETSCESMRPQAAAAAHCERHAASQEHRSCRHCDACGALTAMQPFQAPVLLPRGIAVEPSLPPTRESVGPPLDRLDRPPR